MTNKSFAFTPKSNGLSFHCNRLKYWAQNKKESLCLFLRCNNNLKIDGKPVQKEKQGIVKGSNVNKIKNLLKPIASGYQGKKCLVLDLDETLVHSSFKHVPKADFIVPIEIEGNVHDVFVLKRPGVDEFMERMGKLYEIVIFTASLSKYADPVLDRFDLHKVVHHRLFRESCLNREGVFIKDLSMLGRDLNHVIIVDNSPASYIFHPSNAIPVSTWFNDRHDRELLDLIPFLEELAHVDSVVDVLNISFI